MLKVHSTKAFRQDFKRMFKAGKDMQKLLDLMQLLEQERPLEKSYQNHSLQGIWKNYQECHIAPNWLLVYRIDGDILTFARTGSHSDIFQKY
jgi:mRNA interferase YafQ